MAYYTKAAAMHRWFNSAGQNVPVFDVGGATLHHKDSFRYLGMVFYRTLNMANLRSLRRILGVKNSTTNWAVLRECGQEPLQFFWFRASIRLFNSMLDSNSETLRHAKMSKR